MGYNIEISRVVAEPPDYTFPLGPITDNHNDIADGKGALLCTLYPCAARKTFRTSLVNMISAFRAPPENEEGKDGDTHTHTVRFSLGGLFAMVIRDQRWWR